MLPNGKLFPAVVPLDGALMVLESDDEDVGVIVSTKDVLVRVDEAIRELVADLVHILFGVGVICE